jgi:hypothetical protein
MQYIYIDESGDLGFDFTKKGTSRYFVVAAIVTESPKPLEKIVLEASKQFKKTFRKRHPGVFHATHESDGIRRMLCEGISSARCFIRGVYFDKRKNKQRGEGVYLKLLWKHIDLCNKDQVTLVISRRYTNRAQNIHLIEQLQSLAKDNVKIEVTIPTKEKILQLADLVSWVVFNKYENGNERWFNLIKDKIEKEIRI